MPWFVGLLLLSVALVGVAPWASNSGECEVAGGLVVVVWADEAAESVVWFEVEVSVEFVEFVRLIGEEPPKLWVAESSGEPRISTSEAINN